MPKEVKNKNRLPPFVPLLISTIESPAWKAMSFGARSLYVALKRRVPNGRNRAYLSYRQAGNEIGSGRTQVGEWFKELEHYGFIVLVLPGCLGMDGKGKAPHWRLTELGQTSKTSPDGLPEPPTRDFQNWDGGKFRIPSRRAGHPVPPWRTPLSRRAGHPEAEVSRRAGHREAEECPAVGAITSLPLTNGNADAATAAKLRKRKLTLLHRWNGAKREASASQ